MIDVFEYTDQEIEDAILFVVNDKPNKKWSEEELYEAVNNHLMEDTVIKNLEQLQKDGIIEEVTPDHFVVTQKGLELEKEMEKENEMS